MKRFLVPALLRAKYRAQPGQLASARHFPMVRWIRASRDRIAALERLPIPANQAQVRYQLLIRCQC